jgi:hypothetical protein
VRILHKSEDRRDCSVQIEKTKKVPKERKKRKEKPGANPTIVNCNASAVKIYNTISSLVRFGNKNIFLFFEKTL